MVANTYGGRLSVAIFWDKDPEGSTLVLDIPDFLSVTM